MRIENLLRRAFQAGFELAILPPVVAVMAIHKAHDAAAEIGRIGLERWIRERYNQLVKDGERMFRVVRIFNRG